MPRITFQSLARRNEIGANSYFLEMGQTRLLLDAGMHPKIEGPTSLPDFDELRDLSIHAGIITHAHLDHIGGLPVFQRRHGEAEIIMTEPTAALTNAMLHNSVNVMLAKREQHGVKEYPLFSHAEVDRQERAWSLRRIDAPFSVGPDDVQCRFHDAGHILGAAGLSLQLDGARIFYSGDVHFEDQTLMRSAAFPEDPVDTLILETTRGAAPRAEGYTRQKEAQRMAALITDTIQKGGSVLMPVFALGKTQEMLLLLHELTRSGLLPRHAPVQIGGLAAKMTQITDKFCEKVRRRHAGVRIMDLRELVAPNARKERTRLSYAPGRIYALSSGMMTENTASNDFAFQFIDNPKNTLAFVGYADPDSPAGRILAAKHGDPVTLDDRHAPVELRCRVDKFDFSGHAPRQELVDFAQRVKPRKVLLVHGDEPALRWFEQELKTKLPDSDIIVPVPGEILRLH